MSRVQENPRDCPVTRTVSYIGGKWKPIILVLLKDSTMRFGRLTVFLPTISRKILTQQLRELESDGLIIRHSYNEKPPRVEYELSEKGKTLLPVIQAMYDWGLRVDQVSKD